MERIVSHYSHWLAMPSIGHRLHEYVLRERLNLEEFARLPALRYLYSRLFFADVSTREITVCGFHDSFNADLAKIKRLTDYDFDVLEENVNSSSSYRSMQDNLLADAALTRNLRDILIEDTRFYDNMRTRSVAVQ